MRITRNHRGRSARNTLIALSFGGLLALGTFTFAPANAHADDIKECIRIVDDLTDRCWGEDPGFWRKVGCSAAGGLGYMGCIVGETLREIAKAGPGLVPAPK